MISVNLRSNKFVFDCSIALIAIYLLATPDARAVDSPKNQTAANKTSNKQLSQGESMSLTASERALAAKLGFDIHVFEILKERLNCQFYDLTDNDDLPEFQRHSVLDRAPLLEADKDNYLKIKEEYPELAEIVDQALGLYVQRKNDRPAGPTAPRQDPMEAMRKKLGDEKYKRFVKLNNEIEPLRPLLEQELKQMMRAQGHGGALFWNMGPEVYESDAACDAAIAKVKELVAGKTLKNPEVYKPQVKLGIRYKENGANKYSSEPRLDALRPILEPLGYRITDDASIDLKTRQFASKQDADKFMMDAGCKPDLMVLAQQKAAKYIGIHPVLDSDYKDPQIVKILVCQATPFLIGTDSKGLDAMAKQMMDLHVAQKQTPMDPKDANSILKNVVRPMLGGFGSGEMRLEPGTTVQKLGDRRWQLDTPARYTATSTIRIATIMKAPQGSTGFELVKAAGTNGINSSIDNDDVIDKLKYWDSKYGVTVLEANGDSLKIRFKNLPDDLSELCSEIFFFCSEMELSEDENRNAAIMRSMARRLRETKTQSFWWD